VQPVGPTVAILSGGNMEYDGIRALLGAAVSADVATGVATGAV